MRNWIDLFEADETMVAITDLANVYQHDIITYLLSNCPSFERYWLDEHGIMSFNETYVAQFIFGGEIGHSQFEAEQSIKIPLYPAFPVSEIDNSSRAVSPEIVAKYAMRNPVTAPPVFIRREGGRWLVAEGGHRVAAAKARGDETIRAYDLSVFQQIDWYSFD